MGITEDMKKVAQDIVSSYQSRISTVATIIDNTHQILEGFKTERAKMSNQLRETLAREESLRKKDFDSMMKDIFFYQEEREREVKDLLKTFFEEQKEIAEVIKKSLTEGEKVKVNEFRKSLQDIQARQKARENEIKTVLKEFQEEYKAMAESLRSLLNKGEAIRIRDFKEVLNYIRTRQIKRTNAAGAKVDEFRKEREDLASHWHKLTETMAKKKADSLKGGEIAKEVARVSINNN